MIQRRQATSRSKQAEQADITRFSKLMLVNDPHSVTFFSSLVVSPAVSRIFVIPLNFTRTLQGILHWFSARAHGVPGWFKDYI